MGISKLSAALLLAGLCAEAAPPTVYGPPVRALDAQGRVVLIVKLRDATAFEVESVDGRLRRQFTIGPAICPRVMANRAKCVVPIETPGWNYHAPPGPMPEGESSSPQPQPQFHYQARAKSSVPIPPAGSKHWTRSGWEREAQVYCASSTPGPCPSVKWPQASTAYPPPVPDAPLIASATSPVSGSQIVLVWQDQSAWETGFRVYRSTDLVNWIVDGAAPATNIGWVVTYWSTGLAPSTLYHFKVSAFGEHGEWP